MLRSYRYIHLDVFTDRLFGGNQLAVFLDGRGLSGATMQAIAKEMNYSETTFVLPPERPDTDVRVRIFTRRPRNCLSPDIRRSARPSRWPERAS